MFLFEVYWRLANTNNIKCRCPNVIQVSKISLHIFKVLVVLHIAVLFSWTLYLEIEKGSFASISFALSQIIIFSFATFSLVYMAIKTHAIICMIDQMNRNFKIRSAKGKINIVLIMWWYQLIWIIEGLTFITSRKSYYWSSLITTSFVIVSEVGVLQWVVIAFFTKERDLPLNAWYPFDKFVSCLDTYFNVNFNESFKASPMYELLFVIQTIAQFMLALAHCTPSSIFLSASIMICGQYDLLCCSLKNLLNTAMMKNGGYHKELK